MRISKIVALAGASALAVTAAGTSLVAHAALAGGTVQVVTDGTASWATQAYECTEGGADLIPQQSSVLGPQRTPFGHGSHQITIGQSTAQTELYRTDAYDGVEVGSLTRLAYSTYAKSSKVNGADRQPTYLRLNVDTNDDQVRDTSLFFFPANNADQHPVENGQWQSWNVGSGHISVDGDGGPGATTTLAEFATANPGATLVNNNGGNVDGGALALINGCGLGGNGDAQINGVYDVDRVIVGNDGVDTLYDFETGSAETTQASTNRVVDPTHMSPWVSQAYDYVNGPDLTSDQAFVAGPSTPPVGVGSLRFTISDDSNPNRVEQFRTAAYDARLLRDVRHLSFATYTHPFAGNPNQQQPVYLYLKVDTNGDSAVDDVLFFYPGNNAAQHSVADNTWQTWDATAGQWSVNGDSGPASTVTLDEYLVQNPDAVLVNSRSGESAGGSVTFQTGGGGDSQTNGDYYLDDVNIRTVDAASSMAVSGTEYDLEPTIPAPGITVGNRTQVEGNTDSSAFTFHVRLDQPTLKPVTVNYQTADGTAVAGTDYTATEGAVTFAPGETDKTVTVDVLGDKTFEPNETFFVQISNPSLGTVTDGSGRGQISNDDTLVTATGHNAAGNHISVTVKTRPAAANAPVTIKRQQTGTDTVLYTGTLDDAGRLDQLLTQKFTSGKTIKVYAVVTTTNGTYRSVTNSVVID